MTFLLQKHYAVALASPRVRKGFRFSASGVAATGRLLAACLLIAGFLGVGVGSAMAQSKILRLGGGGVVVPMARNDAGVLVADGTNGDLEVHHYQIGSAKAVQNPSGITSGGSQQSGTFLVTGLALVAVNIDTDQMTVTPIATGAFKIALSPDGDADLVTTGTDYSSNSNKGTAVEFVILSANAPMLTKVGGTAATYNANADSDSHPVSLAPRDKATSNAINLIPLFSDPNDVSLTYTVTAEQAAKGSGLVGSTATPPAARTAAETIVTPTISATSMLTLTLTDKARAQDVVNVWVRATDAAGEYARKRIVLTVGSTKNPFVMTALKDQTIREDGANVTLANLGAGFTDPDLDKETDVDDPDPASAADATIDNDNWPTAATRDLSYTLKISDASASKVGSGDDSFTWVTSYMTATVTMGTTAPQIIIDPRAVGTATITVTATDTGHICRAGHVPIAKDGYTTGSAGDDPNDSQFTGTNADDAPTGCAAGHDQNINNDGTQTPSPKPTRTTGLYPDSKSISDSFVINIISKTTPSVATAIGAKSVTADKPDKPLMVDLEDLNGTTAGEPMAFNDPTKGGLTYTAKAAMATKDPKEAVTLSVEGSVLTAVPVWRAGGATVKVTVTATNTLDETAEAEFDLTVATATVPIVNPLVAPLLAQGFATTVGKKLEVKLFNITNKTKADEIIPVFIDPNASTTDALPGGLELKMRVEDVVTPHRYDDLSRENHVVASWGTITLDPSTGTLTVIPTAANSAEVTVWATDRERTTISAKTMLTVMAAVSAEGEELPTEVGLSQNYPNPFNPQTTIEYALPEAGDVSLVVYDMLGREVRTLLDGSQSAGRHTVRFSADGLPNGTYVYRLAAPGKTITRTMVLVK